jgi:hypothetical protein
MTNKSDPSTAVPDGTASKRRGGRKEVLTEDLAKRIAAMVRKMPDLDVPVTWENIITHTKKKFGHQFKRNALSQKAWGGRKLISEAFDEAKGVGRRLRYERAPKYEGASRTALQHRIAELEARILALGEELEAARTQHYDRLSLILDDRTSLNRMVEEWAASQDKT